MTDSFLPALAVFTPFAGGLAIVLLRRWPNARDGASLVSASITFLLAASAIPSAFAGQPLSVTLARFAPGLEVTFTADALGLLFATVASFLWIPTTVYSIGYMRGLREHAQTRYYLFFALVIGAAVAVAFAANLFVLLLFYEVLTLATYPLVIHKETPEAFRAGRKYLVYTLAGGSSILAAVAILWGLTGETGFVAGGNPVLAALPSNAILAVFALLIAGFGVKSTLVPLHGWLPSAMVAPIPVSGLLHAVAVVKAGVFGILRSVFFLLGPSLVSGQDLQIPLAVVASITILVGSLLALLQDDLKLRLAYSTISQLSYVVLGAALLTPYALIGASFHIAAHGFAKLTMFFVAGTIAVETGKTRISELDGIGRAMPGTMTAFALAAFGMISLPPLAGFVSKWYLTVGAWQAASPGIVLLLAVSSVLNAAYFLPIVTRSFLAPSTGPRREARKSLSGPAWATGAGALLLGTWATLPWGPFEIAQFLAREVGG